MPCDEHEESGEDRACVHCFIDQVLAIDPDDEAVESKVDDLTLWYSALKLTPKDEELCLPIIANLNLQLDGSHLGETLDEGDILDGHRGLYRERMREDGTWIGFYELEVLARVFNVRFHVAIPKGDGEKSRLYTIGSGLGAPRVIQRLVLRWTGNHYEVGYIVYPSGNAYVVDCLRETNGLGNCGLEAFLAMIVCASETRVAVRTLVHPTYPLVATLIRDFVQVIQGTGNSRVDSDSEEYQRALRNVRDVMMTEMTDQEVNHAILAEGVLPEKRSETSETGETGGTSGGSTTGLRTWQEIMLVDEARTLVLAQGRLSPVRVGVTDGGFLETHRLLRGSVEAVEVNGAKKEHGTLCAGVITADADGECLGGVARADDEGKLDVKLRLRAYGKTSSGPEDVKAWRHSITNNGVRVVSMSYKTEREKRSDTGKAIEELNGECRLARHPGCVFVVAAGNEGVHIKKDLYALGRAAIVVTSTSLYGDDHVERLIKDCNRGLGVTVCAPGGGSAPTNGPRDGLLVVKSTTDNGGLDDHTNTSCATPLVAGVVALMLAVNPGLTAAEVKTILILTAEQIDDQDPSWNAKHDYSPLSLAEGLGRSARPYSVKYGFGRVNAEAAVTMARDRIRPREPEESIPPPSKKGGPKKGGKGNKSSIDISTPKSTSGIPKVGKKRGGNGKGW